MDKLLEVVEHIFTTICFQGLIPGRASRLALLVAVTSCMWYVWVEGGGEASCPPELGEVV